MLAVECVWEWGCVLVIRIFSLHWRRKQIESVCVGVGLDLSEILTSQKRKKERKKEIRKKEKKGFWSWLCMTLQKSSPPPGSDAYGLLMYMNTFYILT